jgi:hypothetical protein
MEEVAVELQVGREIGDEVRSPVKRVADDRMAEGLRVNPDLMGAACFNADLNEGKGTIPSCETFEHMEV